MSLRERARPGLRIIEPCLPSPAKVPPSGPGWIHEIKHDGFRILAPDPNAPAKFSPYQKLSASLSSPSKPNFLAQALNAAL